MFVYFVEIKFSWILFNFLSTIIYGVLYTISGCLRYNICSAWFLILEYQLVKHKILMMDFIRV